jgi:Zn-finger nucleic acid-binding protein
MNCFGCGEVMKKASRDGVLVDTCPTCGGIWLDAGELDALERKEGKERSELLHQARQELAEESQQILRLVGMCPKCQAAKLKVLVRHGIQLDYCPSCKGLYFDHLELDRVMQASKEKGPGGFLDSVLAFFKKDAG